MEDGFLLGGPKMMLRSTVVVEVLSVTCGMSRTSGMSILERSCVLSPARTATHGFFCCFSKAFCRMDCNFSSDAFIISSCNSAMTRTFSPICSNAEKNRAIHSAIFFRAFLSGFLATYAHCSAMQHASKYSGFLSDTVNWLASRMSRYLTGCCTIRATQFSIKPNISSSGVHFFEFLRLDSKAWLDWASAWRIPLSTMMECSIFSHCWRTNVSTLDDAQNLSSEENALEDVDADMCKRGQ
jgi:hypothetical protein